MLPKADLNSIDGLTGGKILFLFSFSFSHFFKVYPVRTNVEHRQHAKQYKVAESGDDQHQRGGLFKMNGARYYTLSRLPYFDAVNMSILDPMHNILLGERDLFFLYFILG